MLKPMKPRTVTKTKSSKTVQIGNESVVPFTCVYDGEGVGGSKTATSLNQHESAEKDQLRDSFSSAKGACSKSYHDEERDAMMQMRQKERRQEYVKKRTQL